MKDEVKDFYSVTLKLPFCGVTVARRTMATPQQRAQVAEWYAETKSFITLRNSASVWR
jgi:hypothetical protein